MHFIVLLIHARYGSFSVFMIGSSFVSVSPVHSMRLCSKLHCMESFRMWCCFCSVASAFFLAMWDSSVIKFWFSFASVMSMSCSSCSALTRYQAFCQLRSPFLCVALWFCGAFSFGYTGSVRRFCSWFLRGEIFLILCFPPSLVSSIALIVRFERLPVFCFRGCSFYLFRVFLLFPLFPYCRVFFLI